MPDLVINLKAVDQASGVIQGFKGTWTELKAGLDLAKRGFDAVSGAVKSVINPVVAYAESVRNLSTFTGISAVEASKLVNIADNLKIEYNTLRTAARKLVDDGLQPNVETMAKLSDQYLQIQDPVRRSQFLLETFGSRAGPEMARLLEMGGNAIRELGDETMRLGLVMDEEGLRKTRAYELALNDFNDSVLAAKIALADALLPALTTTVNAGAGWVAMWKLNTEALVEGKIGLLEWAAAGADVTLTGTTLESKIADLNAKLAEQDTRAELTAHSLRENYTAATADATGAQQDGNAAVSAGLDVYGEYIAMLTNYAGPAIDGVKNSTDLVTDSFRNFTRELFFNTAMASLDGNAGAQLLLAEQLGLVDHATQLVMAKIPELTAQYDLNGDGAVTAGEDVQGYVRALMDLLAQAEAIDGKHTTSTHTHTNYIYNVGENDTIAPPSLLTPPETGGAPQHFAHGGSFWGGPMVVGEQGPELLWPERGGYVMNHGDSSRLIAALETIAAGAVYRGGVNININGAGNPGNVAVAVRAELERMGRSADARIRTGS